MDFTIYKVKSAKILNKSKDFLWISRQNIATKYTEYE